MGDNDNLNVPTLTVVSSRAALRPDGTTALILDTKEMGAIAFAVDLQAVQYLRSELAEIETFLVQQPGWA